MRNKASAPSITSSYIGLTLIVILVFLFIRSLRALLLNGPIYLEDYATTLFKKITDIFGTARHDFICRECTTNTMLFPYKDRCKGALFRVGLWQWNELHVSNDYPLFETFLSKRRPSNLIIETILNDEYIYPVPKEVKVTKNLSLDDVYRRMARGSDRTPSASPARALEALLHKEISSTAAAANDDDGDGDSASLDLFALMSRYFDEISFEAYFSHLQGNDASLPGDSQSLLQKCHESHDALSAREIRRRAGVLDLLDPPPSDAPLRAAVSAAMGLIAAHRNTGGDRACGVLNDSHFLLGLNEISSGHSEQIKKSDPSSADLCVKYLRMFLSNSDAMAAVVVWFLWDISNRQDIYASLQRNVDSFLASGEAVRGSSLFHRDVHDPLMLFRCCFLESLRMHPPCADGVFITTTEHVPAGEHSIHKNSVVNFPYYSLLRPLWMEDPNEYLPRRWTDVHHQYDTLLHVFALIFEEDEAKHPAQFAAIYNIIDVVLHIIHTYDFRFESITPSSLHVLKPTKAFVKLNRRVRATSS